MRDRAVELTFVCKECGRTTTEEFLTIRTPPENCFNCWHQANFGSTPPIGDGTIVDGGQNDQ